MQRLGLVRACMRLLLITLLAGCALSFTAHPTVASKAKIKACELVNSKRPSDSAKVASWLKKLVLGFFTLDTGTAQPAATPAAGDLYFTDASNFSQQPVCRTDAAPSSINHFYYPIGLVVKKLGEVDLRGDYWLVETEYGLKTFINPSDLSPLRKDSVYFFANTTTVGKSYCLNQPDKPCTPKDYISNRRIDPRTRYAVAQASQFKQFDTEDKNFILSDPTWPCGTVKVGIYARGKRAGTDDAAEFGRLNTCTEPDTKVAGSGVQPEDAKPLLDPALKIVRLADYQAYFAKQVDGALLRVDSGLLRKLAPEFATEKPCNSTLAFETDTKYSIKGGAGVKFKLFAAIELGGDAAKSYLHQFKQEYSKNVAIALHAYDLKTDIEEGHADAAPIQIFYGCQDTASAPQNAQEIRVSHPSLGASSDFVVGIKNSDDPGDKSGVLAIPSAGKSQLFNQGYVFTIDGPTDYFNIRDKVRGLLLEQAYDNIQVLYDDTRDPLYRMRTADFLTHLIIATAGKPGRVVKP